MAELSSNTAVYSTTCSYTDLSTCCCISAFSLTLLLFGHLADCLSTWKQRLYVNSLFAHLSVRPSTCLSACVNEKEMKWSLNSQLLQSDTRAGCGLFALLRAVSRGTSIPSSVLKYNWCQGCGMCFTGCGGGTNSSNGAVIVRLCCNRVLTQRLKISTNIVPICITFGWPQFYGRIMALNIKHVYTFKKGSIKVLLWHFWKYSYSLSCQKFEGRFNTISISAL